MSDLECPYCGEPNEVCHDDGQGYEEDVPHQMECSDCGKRFVFFTSISLYYRPRKMTDEESAKLSGKPR